MLYPTKKLGEICRITSSKRVFKSEWKKAGVPFYRAREIVKLVNNGFVENELFITESMFQEYSDKYGSPEENDIMITAVGTLGVCYVVKKSDKFYFKDGNIIWLKPNLEKINSHYIKYLFLSEFIQRQVHHTTGTSVGTYTIVRAKNTIIPLPPLPTQKLIVQKLDLAFKKLDKSIHLTKKNLQNIEELNKSVLEEIVRELIEKYGVKNLKDITNLITDGSHFSPKTVDLGFPYITVKDLDWNGNIDIINCKKITEEDFTKLKKGNCSPINGDILFSKDGTVGKTAIVKDIKIVILSSLAIIRGNNNTFPNYLYYVFISDYFLNIALGKKTGAAIKRIVLKTIKQIQIPLPPLQKQKEIVQYLDTVFEKNKTLKEKLEKNLANLQEMKQSLLKEAFENEDFVR